MDPGLGEVDDAFKLVQMFKRDHLHSGNFMPLIGNPWTMPPEAVAEKGLLAIESYLTNVRTAQEAGVGLTCLKLLKVVLVGSSEAGKTRYDVGSLPILVNCHDQQHRYKADRTYPPAGIPLKLSRVCYQRYRQQG